MRLLLHTYIYISYHIGYLATTVLLQGAVYYTDTCTIHKLLLLPSVVLVVPVVLVEQLILLVLVQVVLVVLVVIVGLLVLLVQVQVVFVVLSVVLVWSGSKCGIMLTSLKCNAVQI